MVFLSVAAEGSLSMSDPILVDEAGAFFGSISIVYSEPKPASYQCVHVHTRSFMGDRLEDRSFASGDANYDYHCAMIWLEVQGCQTISGSSSCDHFQMDGGVIDLEAPGLRDRLRDYLATISPQSDSAAAKQPEAENTHDRS